MFDVRFEVKKANVNFLVLSLLLCAMSVSADDVVAAQSQLPLNDLRTFTQVYDEIRSAYVEEVDDKTLLKNAIIGMLTQLDPHSAYLDKSAFQELQTSGRMA